MAHASSVSNIFEIEIKPKQFLFYNVFQLLRFVLNELLAAVYYAYHQEMTFFLGLEAMIKLS